LKAWGYASSPFVDGDRLLLNIGPTGTVLDKRTGETLRAGITNIWGFSTPQFVGGQSPRRLLLFQFQLSCVDPDSGREVWNHSFDTSYMHVMDPVVSGDLVFVSSYDWKSAVLRMNGDRPPEVVWHNDNLVAVLNSPVLLDGFLYGIHGHGEKNEEVDLRCVHMASGEVKWRFKGLGFGSLIAADGKLIVLGGQGELTILKATPDAPEVLARAQVLGGKCWASPVLSGGQLYCRNGAGDAVCLALK
jgi:outer membrane protein assembly factor BamB